MEITALSGSDFDGIQQLAHFSLQRSDLGFVLGDGVRLGLLGIELAAIELG
jgi:hypothetical protein